MTPDDLAAHLLAHAEHMVSSGQFRGTVREYLGFQWSYPARDDALRMLTEKETEAAGVAVATFDEEE